MIDAIIEFSARNRFVVFLAVALGDAGRALLDADDAARRHPRPQRHAGHRLLALGSQPRHHRGPGHVPHRDGHARRAAREGRARVLGLRLLVRLHHLRGGHRHLLGAITRTLEYLSGVLPRLPAGRAARSSAPTRRASAGSSSTRWSTRPARQSLADLRSYQDWYLRYYLKSVPGVAEVAPIGGFVRQYQVQVDPNRLRAFNIPIDKVVEAVRAGNNDVGGRLVEMTGAEYMVRGRGYAQSTEDLGNIVLAHERRAAGPSASRTWARSRSAPTSDAASPISTARATWSAGIVVMRQGENALDVIERVKAKLEELKPSLPPGVEVVTTYDRSDLIQRSIDNLEDTLIEELVIVSLVILRLPLAHPERHHPDHHDSGRHHHRVHPDADDGAQLQHHVARRDRDRRRRDGGCGHRRRRADAQEAGGLWDRTGRKEDYRRVVIDAVKEVGGPSFFALLVIAVSFLPVLTLEAQEGRLFKPLAYTKNLSMIVAAVLAITLDPAMRLLFTHTKNFSFRPRVAGPDRQRGAGRHDPLRGTPPDQPRPDPRLRAHLRVGAALEVAGDRVGGRDDRWPRSRSISDSGPSSCRRSTRARCSTCRPRCPGSR